MTQKQTIRYNRTSVCFLFRIMMTIPTPIYHFTHIDNLPHLLESGTFRCCREMQEEGTAYRNIAYSDLQGRRSVRQVPVHPFGTLHDYVPFYFAPRSPMLYTISRGNVAHYQGDQSSLIYFVPTAQRIASAEHPFVFTDGHGIMYWTRFYNNLSHLDQVDWEIMQSNFWNDTTANPDRKRKRQAEFLVYKEAPLSLFSEIAVMTSVKKIQVEQKLVVAGISMPVTVHQDWYY